jgi:glycosyltransferase involved in cell wall biosynthesis
VNIALNAMQVRAAKSGVGQYIHALLESLLDHAGAHSFTVYCSTQNAGNYDFPNAKLTLKTWGMPETARSLRLMYEYAFLPNEIRNSGHDLFHGMSNFLPIRKMCPYVVTIHDLSYFVQPWRCRFVRRRYWYLMTRRTVKVADRIITVSENSRHDIGRYFPEARERIVVIPEAAHQRFQPLNKSRGQSLIIDTARFNLDGRPFLLYVGTLEPGKNVKRIIEAFDLIADRYPEHLLVLAGGKGWLYEPILEAAQRAKAASRILFTGHVSDSEVVELLNYCEAFVYPSLYEGFGLPPLEAMACGAPVIASNSSSLPEVTGDAALAVHPESVQEIAQAMRDLLANPSKRADLRARGLERAQLFSWKKAARQTLDVYEDLARR